MTIIAYHDGLLIADRKATVKSSFTEVVTERQKIFTSACGRYALGVAGRIQSPEHMDIIIPELVEHTLNYKPTIQFSKTCLEVINLSEHSTFLIITAKQVAVFTGTELQFIPNGAPVFLGSGDCLAKGYWLSGKSLRKSVEFAASVDSYCGTVFDTIDCKKLFKKSAAITKAGRTK